MCWMSKAIQNNMYVSNQLASTFSGDLPQKPPQIFISLRNNLCFVLALTRTFSEKN